MTIPPSLKSGDKVAIVATAKRMDYDFQKALDTLTSWGLEPVLGNFPLEKEGYFAGTDKQKIQDLSWALNSDEIRGIVFLRGGYGTTRILDQISFDKFLTKPKWMVGYSDLTSLILQMDKLDVPMIHGPMCYTLGKDVASDNILRELLFGSTTTKYNCRTITEGEVGGKIVGGNLSMIYESIGAFNQIDTDGTLLFLEDVGEEMYSIDRMMTKLKRVGLLEGIKGLILGSFTAIRNSDNFFSHSIEELILSYFPQHIPIAVGLNAGHDPENLSMIMNRNSEVTIGNNQLEISYL